MVVVRGSCIVMGAAMGTLMRRSTYACAVHAPTGILFEGIGVQGLLPRALRGIPEFSHTSRGTWYVGQAADILPHSMGTTAV